MLSKDSTESQASPASGAAAGTAGAPAVMDPGSPIEVASTGSGTINDPAGTDNKPPRVGDLDPLSFLV